MDDDMILNKDLLKIIGIYKAWYDAGLQPTEKNFLYHEDQALSALVVSLVEFPYEVSKNWLEHFEMPVPSREETYKEEVASTVHYLQLRKIKQMIAENQKDLAKVTDPEKQLTLMQTHQHLKEIEISLTVQLGTVIYK